LKAKKSFGQHFLHNKNLARSIVDLAKAHARDLKILEVGPGRAALTQFMIEDNTNFMAVEADWDMITYLSETYPDFTDQFIRKDFLKLNFEEVNDSNPFLVLGNFPYNISSQIIFKIIDNHLLVPTIIGMFQKEVADRIVAGHGSKTYGVISILIQYYYDCKIVFKVAPGSFSPPPKVQSAVVLFTHRESLPECDPSLFKSVIKISFGNRRKMMRNTLKSFIKNTPLEGDELFEKRPEQLSLEQFVELTNLIEKHQSTKK